MQKKGVEVEMLRWRPYKCRKKGSGAISSARVTYLCAAITDLLSKPVYRKVFSCEVHQARKLTPLLVKGKWMKVLVCFMWPCVGLWSMSFDAWIYCLSQWMSSVSSQSLYSNPFLIPCYFWWAFWSFSRPYGCISKRQRETGASWHLSLPGIQFHLVTHGHIRSGK